MGGLINTIIWFAVIWFVISKITGKHDKKKQNQPNINGRPVSRQNETLERVGNLVKENAIKFGKQAEKWLDEAETKTTPKSYANMGTAGQQTPNSYSNQVRGQQTMNRNASANSNRVQNTAASRARQAYTATPSPKGQAYQTPKAATPSIVQRAKANTKKYEADETLHELESEHKHSEKVSSAEAAYVVKDREEHMKMHMEPAAHAEDENLLGSVEDLMVKGYDGNLSFERDFVGEAMDMINRFTLAG